MVLALSTLAMGDNLAVEIAQRCHCCLIERRAGALRDHEVVKYRHPLPRGLFDRDAQH